MSSTVEKLEAYNRFLAAKMVLAPLSGISVNLSEIDPLCKPHQRDVACWGIRGGCRALFAAFGLGKSKVQAGCERQEDSGTSFLIANNDTVPETIGMADNSVGLICTSIPFATQYEYTPSYNDFGHTDDNEHFWQQMDFLIPELLRVLQPGRVAAIHVKDRIASGGITGLGFQTVQPFHMECHASFTKHGFAYLGMKTIVTDVVRENNQTYRLGWTEQCKDGSRMGVGMPEYLMLFRKPPSDLSNGYADLPVFKDKKSYTRSRWQIDAHGFARSSGNRLLSAEDLLNVKHETMFKLFRRDQFNQVYDYERHVRLSEALETCRVCKHIHTGQKECGAPDCDCHLDGSLLPKKFMLLQPQSLSEDVWTDISRMRTLNGAQSAAGREQHLCPLQFDIVNRVITQFSMVGEVVYDPFMGIGTVPMCAVELGRFGRGVELGPDYFKDAVYYTEEAERKAAVPTLFDLLEVEGVA